MNRWFANLTTFYEAMSSALHSGCRDGAREERYSCPLLPEGRGLTVFRFTPSCMCVCVCVRLCVYVCLSSVCTFVIPGYLLMPCVSCVIVHALQFNYAKMHKQESQLKPRDI